MNTIQLRRVLLAAFLVPMTLGTAFFKYYEWGDSALLLYMYCSFFLSVNLFVWSIWAYYSRLRPSFIFMIVLALCGGVNLVILINTYARWHFVFHPDYYESIISTDWWAYRVLPELLVFIWLFCWTISRIFGGDLVKNGDRLRILLIDDDKVVSVMMHEMIDSMKVFSIDHAYSYSEALNMFIPGKYVVVSIDLNLGKSVKEGVDLAYKFRRDDKDVYIVVISGNFDKQFDERLLTSVDDFLEKPFGASVFRIKMMMWAVGYKNRIKNKEVVK